MACYIVKMQTLLIHDVLSNLKCRGLHASSLPTCEFSTLYTTIHVPLIILKKMLLI